MQGGAEEKWPCDAILPETPAYPGGSSEPGMTLQTCPRKDTCPQMESYCSIFRCLPQGRRHDFVKWVFAAETNLQGADCAAEGSGAKGTPLILEGSHGVHFGILCIPPPRHQCLSRIEPCLADI